MEPNRNDGGAPGESRPGIGVELHGLEPIPEGERYGRPRDLFWTWVGGSYSYVSLTAGALPVLFGLPLSLALVTALLGNVLGAVLFGLCAMPGPRTATATIVNTRAAFGIRGNALPAAVGFFSAFGWVAVNSVLAVMAAAQLLAMAGVAPGKAERLVLFALVLAGQILVAVVGHATVMAMERVYAIVTSLLLSGLFVFALPRALDAGAPATPPEFPAQSGTFLLGLGAIVAGPLSWTNYAADYARYLPRDTPPGRVALWSGLGMGVGNGLGGLLGALLAAAVDMRDPLSNVPSILPSWYVAPFLGVLFCGAIANNVLNLYTAGLGLLALGVRARRWPTVLALGLLAAAPAYVALFVHDFMELFAQFLNLTICFLGPWAAILVVDWMLRRGEYDADALHLRSGGPYWYRDGVNARALGIYVFGVVLALALARGPLWASPLSMELLGGADLSLLAGVPLTGALYYALGQPPRPAPAQDDIPAPEAGGAA
ncbi:purine-cytosine permease family protein [Polyangium aurulentum]|uniref:purine-cytosine permease family protein n=1 Tax=Polyangium aurulentum TaxID=2567896 RepID=UPI0010ADEC6C|nr:cytosine permease [Polyangium aurulentum]UQA58394.1 cytosine permease [Polyangium aurulentum]